MEIDVRLWTIDALPKRRARLERWIRTLPFGEGERERLLNMRNETALRQSLGGWLALWRLAKQRGFAKQSLSVERTETGKPRFADPRLPTFSISHSGALCVAALCGRAEESVGVDVQLAQLRGDPSAIAKRFFTQEEQRLCADDHEQPAAFFKIWTQKEAVAKQSGAGLAAVLSNAEASPSADLRTMRVRYGGQCYYLSVAASEEITAFCVSSKRRGVKIEL